MTTAATLPGLDAAILAVQSAAKTLPKDANNPAFKGSKYTPLDTIVEQIGPLLVANGLTWNTFPTTNEHGQPALRYRLKHVQTGECEEDTMLLLLAKQDMQALGSAVTYARRYALCAVLNLVADDDDDGNAAAKDVLSNPRGAVTEKQRGFLHKLVRDATAAGMTLDGLKEILKEQGVELKDGWLGGLSAMQASALIERFKQGVSDVPSDHPAPEPAGDTTDLPREPET